MFELYPPVYINDATEKKVYIETLSKSFKILSCSPNEWNQHTATFFKHELNRLLSNVNMLYNSVNKTGLKRAMKKSNHI